MLRLQFARASHCASVVATVALNAQFRLVCRICVGLSYSSVDPLCQLWGSSCLQLGLRSSAQILLSPHTAAVLVRPQVVVFDVGIPIRLAFFALVEHECTAAPLWDSARGCFAGMITVTDFIQMMLQYHRAGAAAEALSTNTLAVWKAEQARRLAELRQSTPVRPEDEVAAAVSGAVPLELTGGSALAECHSAAGSDWPPPVPFPSGLVQVRPDTSLLAACRLLRRHRIHRVAVVPRETDWARGEATAVCDAATAAAKVQGDPVAKHDALLRAALRARSGDGAGSAAMPSTASATAVAAAAVARGGSNSSSSGGSSSGVSGEANVATVPSGAGSAAVALPAWHATQDQGLRLLQAAGMAAPSACGSRVAVAGSGASSSSAPAAVATCIQSRSETESAALPPASGRRVAMSRREGRLEDTPAPATVLGIITHRVLLHALVERFSLEEHRAAAAAADRPRLQHAGSSPPPPQPLLSASSSSSSSSAGAAAAGDQGTGGAVLQPAAAAGGGGLPGSGAGVLAEGVFAAGVGTWAREGKPLVSATMETPLAEVLALLAAHRISCVPIVEAGPGGRLLDVWGREDVLFLATDPTLEALSLPVRVTRAAQLAASRGVHSVRTCHPADSLRSVIDTFASTRVARIVGVDPAGRPVGVITISDLFQFFSEAAQDDGPAVGPAQADPPPEPAATAAAPEPRQHALLPPPGPLATAFGGGDAAGAHHFGVSTHDDDDEDGDIDM